MSGIAIPVSAELRELCKVILSKGKTETEWAATESADEFQTPNFTGGFDSTEAAFCFSYRNPQGQDFWFQLSLSEVAEISSGRKMTVGGRPAEGDSLA